MELSKMIVDYSQADSNQINKVESGNNTQGIVSFERKQNISNNPIKDANISSSSSSNELNILLNGKKIRVKNKNKKPKLRKVCFLNKAFQESKISKQNNEVNYIVFTSYQSTIPNSTPLNYGGYFYPSSFDILKRTCLPSIEITPYYIHTGPEQISN